MRKLIMISLLLAGFGSVTAAEVSREQAVEMAKSRVSGTVSSVEAVSYERQTVYYIVQFAEGGWVLVSADDTTMPVIGYSNEGVYQTEDQPDNVRSVMDGYAQQIVDNKLTARQRHTGWETGDVARARQTRATEKIEPLIKVNWNQTGAYKKYCPGTGSNQAIVGCVAVGMAQAMSVAQWPPRPVGDYGYTSQNYGSLYINYDKEPDYNWSDILSGANGKDDVARLLWHCGVSVNMNYGTDGSGTQDSYIASALKRNFQYPQSVKYYSRSGYEGADDEWKELILNELRGGRAVAYSGSDPKGYGHCFNLDGYDGEFFHVNWGWGGSNNGYFPLNGLKDATMGYTYTDGQSVIVGIRPPSEKPSDITLSSTQVQAGQPAGTYVCDVVVESEATNPVYTYTLKGTYNPITHTTATPPFKIEDDKLYTTKVLDAGKNQKVTIIAKNTKNGGSVERTFNIKVTADPTGVTEICVETVGPRQYFSASGVQLPVPGKGLNIIRQRMSDGTTKTVKVFNK